MIFRIQPFATNKAEFGKVLNAHCAVAPEGSWIQLMDWDASITCLESYKIMEIAIERYPNTDIFGCKTNRIGYQHQRFNGEMSEVHNYKHHILIGQALAMKYWDGECTDAWTIAGFFMLFKKSYWERNKFQDLILNEKGRHFDKEFCQGATKMRVIEGVYVFHQYRMMGDWKNNSHLKLPVIGNQSTDLSQSPQS